MFDQQRFIRCSFRAHIRQELFILLIFAQQARVGAHNADPEARKKFALEAFLCVRFANDGALKVEKLAVNGFEKSKKRGATG